MRCGDESVTRAALHRHPCGDMSLQFQRSNGHPEPEVIVNVGDNAHFIHRLIIAVQYADGYAYSKSKFEEGLQIVLADKPAKPAKTHSNLKKEDIDLIVRRFKQVSWPFDHLSQRSQS
jgi:hypothetical protein